MNIIAERFDNLKELQLDNADAAKRLQKLPSSILKARCFGRKTIGNED